MDRFLASHDDHLTGVFSGRIERRVVSKAIAARTLRALEIQMKIDSQRSEAYEQWRSANLQILARDKGRGLYLMAQSPGGTC